MFCHWLTIDSAASVVHLNSLGNSILGSLIVLRALFTERNLFFKDYYVTGRPVSIQCWVLLWNLCTIFESGSNLISEAEAFSQIHIPYMA